jgi:carbamoyl-phosphate synthase small subunit
MTGSALPSGGQALLILEDGTAFAGRALGAVGRTHGEVVFVNGIRPRIEIRGMDGSGW